MIRAAAKEDAVAWSRPPLTGRGAALRVSTDRTVAASPGRKTKSATLRLRSCTSMLLDVVVRRSPREVRGACA